MKDESLAIAVVDAARPGVEHVPAQHVGGPLWRLLRSPLYATGVAAGDVVRVTNRVAGEVEVVERGGNVCVQFYLGPGEVDSAEGTTNVARAIGREIEALGGSVDAYTSGLIAFTVSVEVGFPAIEEVFATAVDRYPGAEWQYSNVYDSVTDAPLGWWHEQ